MNDRPERKRDKARVYAWSGCAAVAVSLGLAGVVYQPKPDPEIYLAGAMMMSRMGAYAQAEEELKQLFAQRPGHKEGLLLLASIQSETGRYAEALDNFLAGMEAIEAKDDAELTAAYRVTTGLLRLRLGHFDEAAQDGDWLIKQETRPAAGCLIRAFSWLGRGDDTAYRQELARAYSMDPYDAVFRLPSGFIAEAIPWTTAFSISDD